MDFWTRIFCVETWSRHTLDFATKTHRSFVNPVCAPLRLSCRNGIELYRRKLRNRGRSSPVQRIFLVVVIKILGNKKGYVPWNSCCSSWIFLRIASFEGEKPLSSARLSISVRRFFISHGSFGITKILTKSASFALQKDLMLVFFIFWLWSENL